MVGCQSHELSGAGVARKGVSSGRYRGAVCDTRTPGAGAPDCTRGAAPNRRSNWCRYDWFQPAATRITMT